MQVLAPLPKRKDCLSIEIDDLPIDLNPLKTTDYTGRFISSAIYEPLINYKNCDISCFNNQEYLIKLYDEFLGDSNSIYQSLLFHLERSNKTPFLSQLISIKNAFKYINSQETKEQLGIKIIDNRTLKIELEYPSVDFFHILQSRYLVPVKDNRPVNNGPYILDDISDNKVTLIKNPNYKNEGNSINFLYFKVNKNIKKSLELYKKGLIDVTCHTQFIHTNSHFNIYKDYQEMASPMLFAFKVKNPTIKDLIFNCFSKTGIAKRLNNIIVPIHTLTTKRDYSGVKEGKSALVTQLKKEKTITLIYAEYYPNGIIVKNLITVLEESGFTVDVTVIKDFKEFLKINTDNYDISLNLFFPNYPHFYSYIRFFIKDIKDIDTKKRALEAFNTKDISALNQLLETTDHYLPLFLGKSIFLKNPSINGRIIDENGYLSLQDLSYNIE